MARRHEALLFARQTLRRARISARFRSVEALKVIHKTAYWGTMTLGSPPQPFKVIFDTGSGNLIIPGSDCTSAGCAPHKKFSRNSSSTAQAVTNEHGESSSEITFGTGQIAGGFLRDKLCVGDSSLCIDASFISADRETTEPFAEIPFDGILGLGFKDLSMGDGFNIVDDLVAKGVLPGGQFSFYLTDGGDSEVTFGGYRPEYLASSIVWAQVRRESYWQVGIDDITFNSKPTGLCGGTGCQVAVDTGTSMLAGPSDLVDKLSQQINAKSDCSNFDSLPKLGFQIGKKVLNLKPDDYMDRSSVEGCTFSLMALDVPPPKGPLFIFGDPFLRRFLTVFDRSEPPRVGFAVAKQTDDSHMDHDFITDAGAPCGDPGMPPQQGAGDNAVTLPLDSGMMGEGSGDNDASASSGQQDEAGAASDSAAGSSSSASSAGHADAATAPMPAIATAPREQGVDGASAAAADPATGFSVGEAADPNTALGATPPAIDAPPGTDADQAVQASQAVASSVASTVAEFKKADADNSNGISPQEFENYLANRWPSEAEARQEAVVAAAVVNDGVARAGQPSSSPDASVPTDGMAVAAAAAPAALSEQLPASQDSGATSASSSGARSDAAVAPQVPSAQASLVNVGEDVLSSRAADASTEQAVAQATADAQAATMDEVPEVDAALSRMKRLRELESLLQKARHARPHRLVSVKLHRGH